MAFTLTFIELFAVGVGLFAPVLTSIAVFILALGQFVGRAEGWSRFDAAYWSLITASTVGYGDLRPTRRSGKLLAVVIAFSGLVFTGIMVGIAVQAATASMTRHVDLEALSRKVDLAPSTAQGSR